MLRTALLFLCLCLPQLGRAQEFPKDFSLPIEGGQGFNQPAGQSPLYLLTLQAVPQVTLIPDRLRLGAVLGGFYPGGRVGLLAGPRLTVKLFQGADVLTASSFNLHLLGEFLWATAMYRQTNTYLQRVRAELVAQGVSPAIADRALAQPGNPAAGTAVTTLIEIRPTTKLTEGGPGGLTFIPAAMQQMFEKGVLAAEKAFANRLSPFTGPV